jgi:hypothetical protein
VTAGGFLIANIDKGSFWQNLVYGTLGQRLWLRRCSSLRAVWGSAWLFSRGFHSVWVAKKAVLSIFEEHRLMRQASVASRIGCTARKTQRDASSSWPAPVAGFDVPKLGLEDPNQTLNPSPDRRNDPVDLLVELIQLQGLAHDAPKGVPVIRENYFPTSTNVTFVRPDRCFLIVSNFIPDMAVVVCRL